MFSGIISALVSVHKIEESHLYVHCQRSEESLCEGESVALDGICFTVVSASVIPALGSVLWGRHLPGQAPAGILPLSTGLSQLKNSPTQIGVTYKENPDKLHVLDPKEFLKYSPPAHLRWLEAKLSQSKIEKIHYIRGLPDHENAALEDLKNGKFDVIFWVSPVSWDEFFKVTESGEVMPQKSTYFFPKILSGPVLYPVS